MTRVSGEPLSSYLQLMVVSIAFKIVGWMYHYSPTATILTGALAAGSLYDARKHPGKKNQTPAAPS